MSSDSPHTDVPATVHQDCGSVVKLTRELVRIPSRGGIDCYGPVLDYMAGWLGENGLTCRRLTGTGGALVGLTCEVIGSRPGPRYVLDACLDTAPFGDESAWTYPPTSAEISEGWMHGRGSSDSKVGAAIFAHIAAGLQRATDRTHGSLVLLFDVDEHTGGFGGAKAYFEGPGAPDQVDGVMIGYPGTAKVVIGGRGVLRARLRVHGIASHSGAGKQATPNAITKAAEVIRVLTSARLPGVEPGFPLPPKLTVTAITGGDGYSTVPDLCTVNVDIRLTPALDDKAAAEFLRTQIASVDAAWPGTRSTELEFTTRWPPYQLAEDSALRTALLDAAHAAGLETIAKVAGPSNIGNYLAGLGIEATAGFGVDHEGLHGTDERIRISTIPAVQYAYQLAVNTLLSRT